MDHQAHGLDLAHPVFTTPNRVTFQYAEQPRPKQYDGGKSVLYPDGVGATLRLAPFEIGPPDGHNPVLVNHEGFFTDVPGFENIAEGFSGKVLGSVSLARQGKFFYFGYSIDPERSTPQGKDVLVNALHWMRAKRGTLTTRFVCTTRQILSVYLDLSRGSNYRRGIEEHLPGSLTEEWRKTYTPTVEGCEAWLAVHLPYVFSGKTEKHTSQRYKTVFEVDADAMALGTPNRERKSLERWLALAAAGVDAADKERAQRCLVRYVHPDIVPKGGDWTGWYRAQKDRIVFVESTGFWWQEDPRVLERERAATAAAARSER